MFRSGTKAEGFTVDGLHAERYRPESEPDGPPIVFVHGGMDRAAGFRRTARHLPNRDLIAYDRRGYAGSLALGAPTRFLDHVDDLRSVCVTFEDAPLIVGHSVGGLICLQLLASAAPAAASRPKGAVLWEPPLSYFDWYPSPADNFGDASPDEVADSFMRWAIGDNLWERMPEAMRNERRAEGPAILSDMQGSREPESTVDFSVIDVPVLVGHGTDSDPRHIRSADEAAARLPDGRLEVIEGASHGIHLDKPLSFATFISSWNR